MLKILVLLVLLMHGIGHIMGFLESWTQIPAGFSDRPSLLSDTLTIESAVGRAFGLLWLVAMVAFVGAAFGLLQLTDWWRPLAIAAAVISLFAIVPWLNTMPPVSAFGAVLVDIAVLVALLFPWADRLIEALR